MHEVDAPSTEELLEGTPYLVGDGDASLARFTTVAGRAMRIRQRASVAAAAISDQAQRVLPQFEAAMRSDLVAESNRMEGIESSPVEIRSLVRVKRDLLEMEVNSFVQYVRDDPRLLDALGLYRAYVVADEWAGSEQRPREFELRGLHKLVMATHRSAGDYKSAPNTIGGSLHVPMAPWDVPQAMSELAKWFISGTGDPVLDAAVVHAWLTHIHPFDDGNGRMARLLANLALIQAHFPPLLLRSGTDRGQYLDALAASDEGDILPLYDLFVKSMRRVVKVMERPNYVQLKIRDELLGTVHQRRAAWRAMIETFYTCLERKVRDAGWSVHRMGTPSVEDFDLLEGRNAEGNGWFLKFRDRRGVEQWLLWFGYRSDGLIDLCGSARRYWPSIFFARRTHDPTAVHPWEAKFQSGERRRPSEISLSPGASKPVTLRWDLKATDLYIEEAAGLIVKSICR